MFTGKGGSPKEYIYNNKQYTTRHIKDYWFKNKNLPFNKDKTIEQNFINIGGKVIKMQLKNRYVIFLGNKKQKKDMMNNFIWNVIPYPKGDNKNYDTSYQTITQTRLF